MAFDADELGLDPEDDDQRDAEECCPECGLAWDDCDCVDEEDE